MSINVQPLISRIRPFIDIGRPLQLATVVDVSGYTTSGPGYVRATIDGVARDVIWRDAPAPAIGATIQVVRMSAAGTAPWLGLPSAPISSALLGLMAFDANFNNFPAGDYSSPGYHAFLVHDTAGGWAIQSYHPYTFADWQTDVQKTSGPNFAAGVAPVFATTTGRLITWMRVDNPTSNRTDWGNYWQTQDTANPNAHYSDDQGVTWSLLGITGVREIYPRPDGSLVAITQDGQRIEASSDNGATWTTLYGDAPSPTLTIDRWRGMFPDPVDSNTVALTASDGLWLTTDNFATIDGPMGPFNQNGQIWTHEPVARMPNGAATCIMPWWNTGQTFGGNTYTQGLMNRVADPFPGSGNTTPIQTMFTPGVSNTDGFANETSRFVNIGATSYFLPDDGFYRVLWQSDDNGLTWTPILEYTNALFADAVAAGNGDFGSSDLVQAPGSTDLWLALSGAGGPGSVWFLDAYSGATRTVYCPRLLRYDGTTWTDATGTLQTDTADGTDRAYAPMRGGLVVFA